jgi:hypothetical protein
LLEGGGGGVGGCLLGRKNLLWNVVMVLRIIFCKKMLIFMEVTARSFGGYSVKQAYHYISKEDLAEALEHKEMI